MESVLSHESIAEYLGHHQRRRAFMRFCSLELLNILVNESKAFIEAKEEEELAKMAQEEEKKRKIAEATEVLYKLGVTAEDIVDALSTAPGGKSIVKKVAYRHPETGVVVHWSGRGQVPKGLKDLVEKFGKDKLHQFAIAE